jgi:hypothetical protein
MKHFSTEEWIDFVNQLLSGERRDTMQAHLDSGCEPCAKTVSLWQRVRQTAAAEAAYEPPAGAVRIAKAAFAAAGFASKQEESKSFAEVLFDSFKQPVMVGARSGLATSRQMLYRADPYQIDLQIEPKPGVNSLVVTGQLMDIADVGSTQGIPVTLSNHRGSSLVAKTNQFGEFSLEIEDSGDLELSVPGRREQPIVIALGNALNRFSRGNA